MNNFDLKVAADGHEVVLGKLGAVAAEGVANGRLAHRGFAEQQHFAPQPKRRDRRAHCRHEFQQQSESETPSNQRRMQQRADLRRALVLMPRLARMQTTVHVTPQHPHARNPNVKHVCGGGGGGGGSSNQLAALQRFAIT